MPVQPTRSDIHVNRPLTNLSIAYIQDQADFIHDKVFPAVPVQKQSDRYIVYTPDFWFRAKAAKRAPATESVGSGFHIDNTPSYFCDKWGFHMDVDDEMRTNADEPINVDRDATEFVTRNLLLQREIQFLGTFMKTTLWKGFVVSGTAYDFAPNLSTPASGLDGYGGGFWSSDTSLPIKDIDNLISGVKSQTGFAPNTLVLSEDVYYALKNHATILDRIKYTQTGIVTTQLMAAVFGVERVLVAGAVLNSAQEGQSASYNYMMTNSFLLTYAAPEPAILRPSAGYIFSWQGLFGAGALGNRIKKFRMEELEADRVEGEMAFSMNLIGPSLSVYGTNVLH